MNRQALVTELLQKYGCTAAWNGQKMPVLIRPLYLQREEDDRYRCTAPCTFQPKTGDSLKCMGHDYAILRSDGVFVGGHRLYTWALLQMQDGWGR